MFAVWTIFFVAQIVQSIAADLVISFKSPVQPYEIFLRDSDNRAIKGKFDSDDAKSVFFSKLKSGNYKIEVHGSRLSYSSEIYHIEDVKIGRDNINFNLGYNPFKVDIAWSIDGFDVPRLTSSQNIVVAKIETDPDGPNHQARLCHYIFLAKKGNEWCATTQLSPGRYRVSIFGESDRSSYVVTSLPIKVSGRETMVLTSRVTTQQ